MKNLIALALIVSTSAAVASPPASAPDLSPQSVREAADAIVSSAAEPVTVTGTRPREREPLAPGFVSFRSAAPRTMSAPPAIDVLTEPVLLTVRTGNTEELRQRTFDFPFESAQDRTVRDSDVLKIRIAKFKLE